MGYTIGLELVEGHESAVLISVEGRCLDSEEGGALLEAIDRCLRAGYDIFLFCLKLESLSAIAFYDAYKKLALYGARMAFVGTEDRLREAFDAYGLESFFAFAETVAEAISRCEASPCFDGSGIGAAIEKAAGPDPEGLALRFSRAPGLIGSLIVRVAGVLDERTLPFLEAKVRAAMELGYPRLVFDMGGTRGWSDRASASFALVLRKAVANEGAIALARLAGESRVAVSSRAVDTMPRVFDSIEESLEFIADGRGV